MQKWELCRIEYKFYSNVTKGIEKAIAVVDTPQGESITKEYAFIGDLPKTHSKLVGELLAEGWEPIHFDDSWRARVFKRLIEER